MTLLERVTLALPAPVVEKDEIIERREIVIDNSSNVPRSVREWDVMEGTVGGSRKSEHLSVHGSVAPSAKSKHTHRSKSAHGSRSGHRSEHRSDNRSEHRSEHKSEHRSERRSSHHSSHHSRRSSSSDTTIKIEKRERERSPSPVVIERKRSKSRRRSRSSVAVKAEITDIEIGESNSMHPGPLALVVPRHSRDDGKDERRIREEIRELELEKKKLKRERREKKYHNDNSDDEVIIEKVERDRRGSISAVTKERKGKLAFPSSAQVGIQRVEMLIH